MIGGMELPKRSDFTADEFIAWALEQPAGRFELTAGEIVAMAPERAGNVRAKLRAVNALADAIAAAGVDCEAMTDGMSVRVDERTVFGPDALVRCGPPIPDDDVEAPDPVVVVEVVSPSSSRIDSGSKLGGYFQLGSVRHYLVVDAVRGFVIHHRRTGPEVIESLIVREGRITLDPPGLLVEVTDLLPAS
jgi:Uma2 family endonuclease